MCGISILLAVFVYFPIFPAAPFLLYDPGDIPVLIGSFMMGPWTGVLMAGIAALVMGVVTGQGGPVGILMNFLSTGTFVFIAGFVYSRIRTRKGAVLGMVAGGIGMAIVMIAANLILTPLYMGVPREVVLGMIIPLILPFNILKAGINSLFTFLVYKKVAVYLRETAAKKDVEEVSRPL